MSTLTYLTTTSDDTKYYCQEVERIIDQGKLKLPVLPHAIQEILAMNNNPEFDIAELSKLIHQDHTLAGHVLRVSNSSVYAGANKTSSLSQAISRLGGHAMVKIAVSITMQGEIFQVAGFKEEIKQIWHHSLASGVYAQEITQISGVADPEMYMCGLMHQVGKPVLLQTLVELSKSDNRPLSHEQVEQILELYHSKVGYQLADGWKMPASVKTSCLYYHDPSKADQSLKAVNITHLASRFADLIMSPMGEKQILIYADPVLEIIGISDKQVGELLDKKDQVLAMMQAVSVRV